MITVRSMTENDLKEVALIHKKAYPADHFTSHFSEELLIKYYSFILKFNEFNYVAIYNSVIAGFVMGGNKTGYAVREFIKKYYLPIIIVLLLHPQFLYSRLINFFKIFKKNKNKSAGGIRLLSIAVDPGLKGKGTGSSLIKKFRDDVLATGNLNFGLSVNTNNESAVALYEKSGFKLEKVQGSVLYYIYHNE